MVSVTTRKYGIGLGDGYCCSDADRNAIVKYILRDDQVRTALLSMSSDEWWPEDFSSKVLQLADCYAVQNKLRVCMLDMTGAEGVTDKLRGRAREARENPSRHE